MSISTQTKNDVYTAYQLWSQSYEQQVNPTRDLSSAILKMLVPTFNAQVIVEAGCGTGLNSQWLAPNCGELIALDFSDKMLAVAKAKESFPHVHFIQHDLQERWPIETGRADLVLLNLVLEHIEDIGIVLSHAATVMQEGAILFITEYHPDRVAQGKGAEVTSEENETVEILNYWHSIEEYRECANKLGLKVQSIEEWAEEIGVDGLPIQTKVKPLVLSICLQK